VLLYILLGLFVTAMFLAVSFPNWEDFSREDSCDGEKSSQQISLGSTTSVKSASEISKKAKENPKKRIGEIDLSLSEKERAYKHENTTSPSKRGTRT
jgi:hypothetical protein